MKRDVREIAKVGGGLGPMLKDQVRRWWAFRNTDRSNPHDPLAALAMLRPDLFLFEDWDVAIERRDIIEGFTSATNSGKGKTTLGADAFVRSAEKEIVRRIAS